jgi:hypothetical protein
MDEEATGGSGFDRGGHVGGSQAEVAPRPDRRGVGGRRRAAQLRLRRRVAEHCGVRRRQPGHPEPARRRPGRRPADPRAGPAGVRRGCRQRVDPRSDRQPDRRSAQRDRHRCPARCPGCREQPGSAAGGAGGEDGRVRPRRPAAGCPSRRIRGLPAGRAGDRGRAEPSVRGARPGQQDDRGGPVLLALAARRQFLTLR